MQGAEVGQAGKPRSGSSQKIPSRSILGICMQENEVSVQGDL
jgi:hypothetical protein